MKADILACWGNTWLDKLIQYGSKGKISHIAIMLDDKYTMESIWYGVALTKYEDKKNHSLILRCSSLTDEQRDAIVEFVKDKVCQPYDYKLLFGLALNKLFGFKTKWDNKGAYICCELIIDAYRSVGIELIENYDVNSATPNDLLFSKYLTIIQ